RPGRHRAAPPRRARARGEPPHAVPPPPAQRVGLRLAVLLAAAGHDGKLPVDARAAPPAHQRPRARPRLELPAAERPRPPLPPPGAARPVLVAVRAPAALVGAGLGSLRPGARLRRGAGRVLHARDPTPLAVAGAGVRLPRGGAGSADGGPATRPDRRAVAPSPGAAPAPWARGPAGGALPGPLAPGAGGPSPPPDPPLA